MIPRRRSKSVVACVGRTGGLSQPRSERTDWPALTVLTGGAPSLEIDRTSGQVRVAAEGASGLRTGGLLHRRGARHRLLQRYGDDHGHGYCHRRRRAEEVARLRPRLTGRARPEHAPHLQGGAGLLECRRRARYLDDRGRLGRRRSQPVATPAGGPPGPPAGGAGALAFMCRVALS